MSERPTLIRLEIEPPFATIVLDHPEKLNAWSWESARQISAHADALRFDDRVRVVTVRAEGRAFCAGVDLGMPEDRITGRSPAEKTRNYFEKFRWVHERFQVLAALPQPVLMAIHGYCLGAGLEIAMMGDIRIAADDAKLGLNFVRLGLHPGMGATWTLPRIVGGSNAAELLYTGRIVTGDEAARIGLVGRALPRERVLSEARELAAEVAAGAPIAIRGLKRALDRSAAASLEDQLSFEASEQAVCFESRDVQEGLAAARARRNPKFQGG